MDENVDAAVAMLGSLAPAQRPTSLSRLATLLQKRGCCAIKVYSQVTPLALAQALLPLLEDRPSLQSEVRLFASSDLQKGNESEPSDFAKAAAKRTLARLRMEGSGTSFFEKQTIYAKGMFLASQAYALIQVEPEKLGQELLRRGVVVIDSQSNCLKYEDALIPRLVKQASRSSSSLRVGGWSAEQEQDTPNLPDSSGSPRARGLSAEKEQNTSQQDTPPLSTDMQKLPKRETWDWKFWKEERVEACTYSDKKNLAGVVKVTGCKFDSSFFGKGGSYIKALKKKLKTMGMDVELSMADGSMLITVKGELPPAAEESLREIVLLIAGSTPPASCRHPIRRGRIKGTCIENISAQLNVRLCRVGETLHLWPTAALLPDVAKKSDLMFMARQLRQATEQLCTTADVELANAFDERATKFADSDYWGKIGRHDRRHWKQAMHIQKVGPGTGAKLQGGAFHFQKEARAHEMDKDRLKSEQRKAHLADKAWRKRYGGKVNRDKRPPMHGGRFKAGEGSVDKEGVTSLSELARVPSTTSEPLPSDEP